jgi:hypothetical protein
MLLAREEMPALDAVERLVGLQAQDPKPPYVALWSRLHAFRGEELGQLLLDREAVRISLMRCTVHLVSAHDCLILRPLMQPVSERTLAGGIWSNGIVGIDREALTRAGRAIVEEKPHTTAQLGEALGPLFPDYDARSMAYAMHTFAPLVHVPPKGVWGRAGQTTVTTAESWLGAPLGPAAPIEDVIRRYLAAFGPASVMDMQAWCGLTRLREGFERLRPELVTYRSEKGTELFDLPDAALPDPATPAPVRFLGEYDNVLLGHADRTRIVSAADRQRMMNVTRFFATFLLDGRVAGRWGIVRDKGSATLRLVPFAPLSKQDALSVEEEAARLLEFMEPSAAARDIQLTYEDGA